MKLYEIIKLLNSHGFNFIKAYPTNEIWEKNGKYLTIPTTYDIVNLRIAKDLKYKIMSNL